MANPILFSRAEFREEVFKRDSFRCVICGNPAVDAHHIFERRLFTDGGYYLDNGASLCAQHHLEAERTILSCEEIRSKAGIKNVILPEHFYSDYNYDKWGNIILSGGMRLKGELFYDESVQIVLKEGGVLDLFRKYVKYPRTYYLPWCIPLKENDRIWNDDSNFLGKRVIVTLKMDGENTTFYSDYIHARSLEWRGHESRDWVKGLWSKVCYLLDENMRICGENLYAVHSIRYENLPSYFLVFSIWVDNRCLSWDETVLYAKIIGLEIVPVIYDGIYDKAKIIAEFSKYEKQHEGYVIRISDEFNYIDFRRSVAKFVRTEFSQKADDSNEHRASKKIETNGLIKS